MPGYGDFSAGIHCLVGCKHQLRLLVVVHVQVIGLLLLTIVTPLVQRFGNNET